MYPSLNACTTVILILPSSPFRLGTASRSCDRLPCVVNRPTDVLLPSRWERDHQLSRNHHQGLSPIEGFPSVIFQRLTDIPGLWLLETESATVYRAKLRRPGVRSTDCLLPSDSLGSISIHETATHRCF